MSEDIFHLGIKALIRNSEDMILLLQVNPKALDGPKRDYWDLPGGRVQKGPNRHRNSHKGSTGRDRRA